MKSTIRVATLFLLAAVPAFSQNRNAIVSNSSPAAIDYETAHLSRIAAAVRITEKITVDGRLEEPAWKLAVPVTDFTQQRPRPGEPATERTEARFLYDEENLYVGAICFESNLGRIVVNDVREDYPWNESDGVNVSIDSLHDHRSVRAGT